MKHRYVSAAAAVLCLALTSGAAASVTVAQDLIETAETEDILSEADGIFEESSKESTVSATLGYAKDWKEVYQALSHAQEDYQPYIIYDETYSVDADYAGSVTSSAATDTVAKSSSSTSERSYSTTNLRDASVDEADVVKTDGTYIYSLSGSRSSAFITVLKAGGEYSSIVDTVDLNEKMSDLKLPTGTSMSLRELYVDDGSISVIATLSGRSETAGYDEVVYGTWYDQTAVITFRMDEKEELVYEDTFLQDGSYQQSRKNGEYITLYTSWWPQVGTGANNSELTVRINNEEAEPEQFLIPQTVSQQRYLVMGSFSVSDPGETVDSKVFVSGSDNLYVVEDHAYVLNTYYRSSSYRTQIAAISLADGVWEPEAACVLRGEVNNSWSIDAYDGYLRVLTTYTGPSNEEMILQLQNEEGLDAYWEWLDEMRWTEHNALFVLDENLETVGRLTDIAEDETIQSARFFGDRVYFVTYYNTDPVFCADLSVPESPRIISEFKTTGFSSYLHPYGDGLLLGIGYETDPDTGETLGLKLSMFETAKDGTISEADKLVIKGITWCPAIEDYKSIFVDAEKNLIGLYHDDRYFLFGYTEGFGFTQIMLYDYFSDNLGGAASYSNMRGLYIEDEFYLAGGDAVIGFDMEQNYERNLILTYVEAESF